MSVTLCVVLSSKILSEPGEAGKLDTPSVDVHQTHFWVFDHLRRLYVGIVEPDFGPFTNHEDEGGSTGNT